MAIAIARVEWLTYFDIRILQIHIEFIVQIGRYRYVGKHAMQFVGELIAACLLQSIDHRLFGIHALRLLVNETLGQHATVELLINVLIFDVLEYGYAAGELRIDFVFGCF